MSEEIQIEKLGSTATFYIGETRDSEIVMRVSWKEKNPIIQDVNDGKVFFRIGIEVDGKKCAGLAVDNEKELREMFEKAREMNENREQEQKQQFLQEVEEKKKNNIINMRYRQGSPLSGWIADSEVDEEIFEEMELLEDIGGWGTKIKEEVMKARTFHIQKGGEEAVVEYQELFEKREAERKKKEKTMEKNKEEYEKKKEKAIEEAKEKGKEVLIRHVDAYDGDEEKPGQELGWVYIDEIATPNGEVIQKETPTY